MTNSTPFIPAKAGIQGSRTQRVRLWVPACAGTIGEATTRRNLLSLTHRISALRRRFEPAIRRVFHLYWRFTRGLTLGVRGIVLDPQGRAFLIRHTYVSGWHLPGGGVEVGETALEALRRELHEEGNIVLEGTPKLHGVFFNVHVSRRDHVIVYVVTAYSQAAMPDPNHEIAEAGFFALDDLPASTTAGTRRRLAEFAGKMRRIETWR